MAFVVDIRRQNMLELLLYKALFEMADNRADFVSQLFSRKRPPNLDAKTNVSALLTAYKAVQPDQKYQQDTLQTMEYYLDDRQQQAFYSNVLALPTDSSSVFLRFISGTGAVMPWWNARIGNTSVVSRISDLRTATSTGRLPTYLDLLRLLKDPYGPSAGLGN
jgi:hypothetical protein